MQVKLLESSNELELICPVLMQLRQLFDTQGLRSQIELQRQEGYQLAYAVDDADTVLAVAGFVINTKLAWGRHLYVDDLVTLESARSSGAGAALLSWLKEHARQHNCKQLHLDSGVHRKGAHKFYFREGLHISSFHFSVDDLDANQC